MCFATPWPSTRSIRAEFISAPREARSMPRPTPGTVGEPIVRDLPAVVSVSADIVTDPIVLPLHLRTLTRVDGEVSLNVTDPSPSGPFSTPRMQYRCSCGTIRDHVTHVRRPFIRFLPANRTVFGTCRRRCPSQYVGRGTVLHCRRRRRRLMPTMKICHSMTDFHGRIKG